MRAKPLGAIVNCEGQIIVSVELLQPGRVVILFKEGLVDGETHGYYGTITRVVTSSIVRKVFGAMR